jgi:hypothetical protein
MFAELIMFLPTTRFDPTAIDSPTAKLLRIAHSIVFTKFATLIFFVILVVSVSLLYEMPNVFSCNLFMGRKYLSSESLLVISYIKDLSHAYRREIFSHRFVLQ